MIRRAISGFTLVELLIVVAIIGALATIGIPTYKTMVQRSKKAEARAALGGIYVAETAFYGEYNTYGNALEKVGFRLEGSGAGRVYTVGFPSATDCAVATAIFPDSATTGSDLNSVYPAYFVGTTTSDTVYPGNSIPSSCAIGSTLEKSYLGVAAGNIGTESSLADIWTMGQTRILANTIDGISTK